jgi:hypothetical protein
MAMTMTIDPRFAFRAEYYTYVIRGLAEVLGNARLRFGAVDVPPTARPREGCALVVRADDRVRRVFVSTGDHSDVDADMLAWADVYGKVNLALEEPTDERLRAIGPVFGIRIWGPMARYRIAARLWRGGVPLGAAIHQMHFQGRGRAPIEQYVARTSDPGYLFFAARRWGPKHPEPDPPRERFIAAAQALPGVHFEGGFFDGERVALGDYLERTARSAAVFNCPAVHGCLGWKLGEFLALGKAIISTPLSRRLPAPLVHGEHLHVVDEADDASLRDALERITTDHEYRRHLERGARRWYEHHLQPTAIARALLDLRSGST